MKNQNYIFILNLIIIIFKLFCLLDNLSVQFIFVLIQKYNFLIFSDYSYKNFSCLVRRFYFLFIYFVKQCTSPVFLSILVILNKPFPLKDLNGKQFNVKNLILNKDNLFLPDKIIK